MSFFTWDDKQLDIGVPEMNKEHQQIVKYMNELWDLNSKNESKAKILKVLGDLGSYTVNHFKDEEAYMQKINYAELAVHQVVHQSLLQKFSKHVEDYKNSSEAKVPEAFFYFLKVWLTGHIMNIDMKYGKGLASKKAA